MSKREILVTHALPYANGPLHIGHLLGYIQSDIWVRARRMAGDTVHFVSADDVHGTPIMLAAEKAGMAPEEFIKGMQISHEADFRDFGVAHDYYYTTHSPENRELAERVYARLRDGRAHCRRSIRQLYDPLRQMFLPDRYIKGICPNCGTPDQYGDNCENCGATYAPTDLKDPHSVLSGATPELRDSEHYFFKVGDFTAFLRDWLAGKLTRRRASDASVGRSQAQGMARRRRRRARLGHLARRTLLRLSEFPMRRASSSMSGSMRRSAISRASKSTAQASAARSRISPPFRSTNSCRPDNPKFDQTAEMHHFIGKDIVNFHGLFWPAMLQGASLRTPNALHVNGYLTVNGEKMSKSRGTFIQARTYLMPG